ncbi:DUF5615 family PIN-like protein [bacterium]|nr:DUF5615 family PIN-like protein [bacterium]
MRFLADESCDFAVVRSLRAEGYDVLSVLEACPGAEDRYVMELAEREGRVLITEDKDFGRLAYVEGAFNVGVLLLRFPAVARDKLCKTVVRLVKRRGKKLQRSFVVVQPGRIRIRQLWKG